MMHYQRQSVIRQHIARSCAKSFVSHCSRNCFCWMKANVFLEDCFDFLQPRIPEAPTLKSGSNSCLEGSFAPVVEGLSGGVVFTSSSCVMSSNEKPKVVAANLVPQKGEGGARVSGAPLAKIAAKAPTINNRDRAERGKYDIILCTTVFKQGSS